MASPRGNKAFRLRLSLARPRALLFALSVLAGSAQFAFAQASPPETSGVFTREHQAAVWAQTPADKKVIQLKFGDVLVTKEKRVAIDVNGSLLLVMPYTAVRMNGKIEGGAVKTAPELLFGEGLFRGRHGRIALPGQNIEASGTVYLIVDDEKFSMAAAVDGEIGILPAGATQSVLLPAGNYLELGPAGESGSPEAMLEDDVALYSRMAPVLDTPKAAPAPGQTDPVEEPLDEYWSRDRITLLKDGPEGAPGLAIASGKTRETEQKTVETPQNIQVFDKAKGPVKKTMTFSTTASSGAAAGAKPVDESQQPKLASIAVARKNASIGEAIGLKAKDLDNRTLAITGKITTPDDNAWKFFIKVNGEETRLDSPQGFEHTIRVAQEFPKTPRVTGVTIGEETASNLREGSVLTRQNLTSGKMAVAGSVNPGQNVMNFNIELVARGADDKDIPLGGFQVSLDLSDIARVEVSTDGGMGWETAKGTLDWTYAFSPSDGDTYKIKLRAFDVMENQSEEQFEPYIFVYRYKTDEETLREAFDTMMRAFQDKDRASFIRTVSQDFKSNYEDLRDYNELKTSVEDRFACCNVSIRYTIREADANRQTQKGSVDFNWVDRTGASGENNSALFNFIIEENEWRLYEVIDPNTFLRASRTPYSLTLTLDKDRLTADGESTCLVRARVLDSAGSIIANGVDVLFSADTGTISPSSGKTENGYAETTYRAPTTSGTATITATSGGVTNTISLTLDPLAAPLPPDVR